MKRSGGDVMRTLSAFGPVRVAIIVAALLTVVAFASAAPRSGEHSLTAHSPHGMEQLGFLRADGA